MSQTNPIELTNMALITNDQGQFLVQQRLKPDWPGITFPGGHIEPGESCHEAIIREVQEETGLTLVQPKLCGIGDFMMPGRRILVLLYRSNNFKGALKSSNEGEVFWLDPKQLLKEKLAGNLQDLLQVMINEQISEFFCPPATTNGQLF